MFCNRSSVLIRTNYKIPIRNKYILRCLQTSQEVILNNLDAPYKGVSVLALNKNDTRNALGKSLVEQFFNQLDRIQNDNNVRVVILKSSVPSVFCAGANLKERVGMNDDEVQSFVCKLRTLASVIENLSVPVIAAMDGVALGGGLEICLSCDLRIAADNVKLGLVETKLGILPGAGGTQRLPRIVGPSIAKELIFTGKIIDAKEANLIGLVNHLVKQNEEGDAAFKKALDLSKDISANAPVSIKMAKLAINKGLEVDINSGCLIEESCYARIIPTKDRLEGLLAYKEKRPPKYKGC